MAVIEDKALVKGRINQTGGVRANINSTTSSGPQQVSVQVPSTNVSITNVNRLRELTDVDSSSLSDGALLQYDASSDKFVTRNELDTTSGTLVFNGGNF
jgi:hypothetical protein|tara:strand:+ start:259 stop:555 length:297 start_codon:yes stop_codon:yes gene_type:complete